MGAGFSSGDIVDTEKCLVSENAYPFGAQGVAATSREGASDISEIKIAQGDFFVIGNEGHGLSQEVVSACSGAAMIPMRGGCESLNAAAAAAIFIWETVRSAK